MVSQAGTEEFQAPGTIASTATTSPILCGSECGQVDTPHLDLQVATMVVVLEQLHFMNSGDLNQLTQPGLIHITPKHPDYQPTSSKT